jgi:hypothetical protein
LEYIENKYQANELLYTLQDYLVKIESVNAPNVDYEEINRLKETISKLSYFILNTRD